MGLFKTLYFHRCRWSCILVVFCCTARADVHPLLRRLATRDSTCRVWVVFADKPETGPRAVLTPHARKRRRRVDFPATAPGDLPVAAHFIESVEKAGGIRRHVFRWANAASFDLPASSIPRINTLPHVSHILPVRRFEARPSTRNAAKSVADTLFEGYGRSRRPFSMLSIPQAHGFVDFVEDQMPGEGVRVALLDNGFTLTHRCLLPVVRRGGIVADSDFVDLDGDVRTADPHGTQTLALIGGYHPGEFMGTAWGADFLLARTENDPVEKHVEEDNWAAAVVWAEERGADVVSSSVGYRNGFEDTIVVDNDTIVDYSFAQMDGRTSIVSIAADSAARRGLVIVNSMGNEAPSLGDTSIVAPADAENVIGVGAITSSGAIAGFSSRGGTPDGRIKPDVVAPGTAISLPTITGSSYTTADGTSFSAPQVAGVCALIVQTHPDASPGTVRGLLFASCAFSPFQDSVDNVYGRGIPNAYLACALAPIDTSPAPDELQVFARSPRGIPAEGAAVMHNDTVILALTDRRGFAAVDLKPVTLPDTLTVTHPLSPSSVDLPVDGGGIRKEVVLEVGQFRISVVDTSGGDVRPVRNATVYAQRIPDGTRDTLRADSGSTTLLFARAVTYRLRADAPGYRAGDTISARLDSASDSTSLILEPVRITELAVYPNVVSLSSSSPTLHFDFVASPDKPRSYSQLLKIAVRTVDGRIVWHREEYLTERRTPSLFRWNLENNAGKTVMPGMYLFVVQYAGKTLIRKFLVTG